MNIIEVPNIFPDRIKIEVGFDNHLCEIDDEKIKVNLRWVPVEERLPDPTFVKRILVYSLRKNILLLHRDYDEWCLTEYEYENGRTFTGESIEFTHWMPLPPLPKKDQT